MPAPHQPTTTSHLHSNQPQQLSGTPTRPVAHLSSHRTTPAGGGCGPVNLPARTAQVPVQHYNILQMKSLPEVQLLKHFIFRRPATKDFILNGPAAREPVPSAAQTISVAAEPPPALYRQPSLHLAFLDKSCCFLKLSNIFRKNGPCKRQFCLISWTTAPILEKSPMFFLSFRSFCLDFFDHYPNRPTFSLFLSSLATFPTPKVGLFSPHSHLSNFEPASQLPQTKFQSKRLDFPPAPPQLSKISGNSVRTARR